MWSLPPPHAIAPSRLHRGRHSEQQLRRTSHSDGAVSCSKRGWSPQHSSQRERSQSSARRRVSKAVSGADAVCVFVSGHASGQFGTEREAELSQKQRSEQSERRIAPHTISTRSLHHRRRIQRQHRHHHQLPHASAIITSNDEEKPIFNGSGEATPEGRSRRHSSCRRHSRRFRSRGRCRCRHVRRRAPP